MRRRPVRRGPLSPTTRPCARGAVALLDPSQRTSRCRAVAARARACRCTCCAASRPRRSSFRCVAAQRRRALTQRWSARLLRAAARSSRASPARSRCAAATCCSSPTTCRGSTSSCSTRMQPVRFVAKSELARWPLVGRLIRDAGTLFIERARTARHAPRQRACAADALPRGDVRRGVSRGHDDRRHDAAAVHGSLLQPIVDAAGHVQPIALRYRDADGAHSTGAAIRRRHDPFMRVVLARVRRARAWSSRSTRAIRRCASRRRRVAARARARCAEDAIRAACRSPASG